MVLEYGIRAFLSERSQVRISAILLLIYCARYGESLQHPCFKPKGHSHEGAC